MKHTPTLSRFHDNAIIPKGTSPAKHLITSELKSSVADTPLPGSRRAIRAIRAALDDSQEVLVSVILWIATLSAITPIAAEGIRKLGEIFSQFPVT